MNIHKLELILFLILISFQTSLLSQITYENNYYDTKIKIKLSTPKLYVNENDSLNVNVSYYNNSIDTILIIDRIIFINSLSKIGKNFQIENGGMLAPGSEYKIKLIKILPMDSVCKNIYITSSYLKSNLFQEFFGLFMSVGYISSLGLLIKNKELSIKEIEVEGDSIVFASSLVVFASLTQKEYTAFYLRYLNN